MTVRNANMWGGGTNWGNEILYPADLNDTFNYISTNIKVSSSGVMISGTGFTITPQDGRPYGKLFLSTGSPISASGGNGDIWFVY
jgi:hypothetical protein